MAAQTSSAPKREWRIIPALELSPRAIAFAQRPLGILALCLVSCAALVFIMPESWLWLAVGPAVAASTLLPAYRRQILLIAALGLLAALDPFRWEVAIAIAQQARLPFNPWLPVALLLSMALAFAGARQLAGRFPQSLFSRASFSLSLLFVFIALAAAQLARSWPAVAMCLWIAVAIMTRYFWFAAYSLAGKSTLAHRPLWRELSFFMPVWNYAIAGSLVPYGKGEAYLAKTEARDADALAVTQLKGIKLLLWACVLTSMYQVLNRIFFAGDSLFGVLDGLPSLALPTLAALLRSSGKGQLAAIFSSWMTVIGSFLIHEMLALTVAGHTAVGIARLTGFNILRNTYRPLTARTIAEFFNRYYYYFKELLVDFFFYPTFLRCFRGHPRLRIFFATFMAAGVGNALYHYLRDFPRVFELGFIGSLQDYSIQILYCAMLGLSIGLSQMLGARRRAPTTWIRGLASNVFVLLFFALMLLFGEEQSHTGLTARLRLLAHLFGAA